MQLNIFKVVIWYNHFACCIHCFKKNGYFITKIFQVSLIHKPSSQKLQLPKSIMLSFFLFPFFNVSNNAISNSHQ